MIGHILLGFLLAHLIWAGVFVAMWWNLIRHVPTDERRTAVQQDFQDVRNSIMRRNEQARRN